MGDVEGDSNISLPNRMGYINQHPFQKFVETTAWIGRDQLLTKLAAFTNCIDKRFVDEELCVDVIVFVDVIKFFGIARYNITR